MEDVTDPEAVRQNNNVDRDICLYGYVRGTHFKNNSSIHIPGKYHLKHHEIISYCIDINKYSFMFFEGISITFGHLCPCLGPV